MKLLEKDVRPIGIEANTPVEQRREARHLCVEGNILRLAVRPTFRGRRALLVDVSVSGIGFLLEEPLEADTILVFELQGAEAAHTISRIARVRHSCRRPVPETAPWLPSVPVLTQLYRLFFGGTAPDPIGEAWQVGCEFDKPLSEPELKQLLEKFLLLDR